MNLNPKTSAGEGIPHFATIRETARMGFIAEHALRTLVREGRCPGFHTGRTFRVNVDALIADLNRVGGSVGGGDAHEA